MINVNLLSKGGHVSYGYREFCVDTEDDLGDLPVDTAPGSVAICIETSAVYMLNSKGEWVEI